MSTAEELCVNRSTIMANNLLRKCKCCLLFINCQNVRDSFSTRFMTFILDPHRTAPVGAVWFGPMLTLVK